MVPEQIWNPQLFCSAIKEGDGISLMRRYDRKWAERRMYVVATRETLAITTNPRRGNGVDWKFPLAKLR